MEYISTREAALKWGVSIRNIQRLLNDNRIPNAKKYGVSWLIPADAEKPADLRKEQNKEKTEQLHLLPCKCPMFATTTIYQQPGTADQVLLSLKNNANAHDLFYAQLQYFKGNYEKAERLCRQLLAKTTCFDTYLGCVHTIANTAMYTGDYLTWQEMHTKVEQLAAVTKVEVKLKELCIAAIDSAIYDSKTYPDWLKSGCFEELPVECFPIVRYFFTKYLAINRADFCTMPILEALCSQTKVEGALISELYQQLLMAIGYHDSGQFARAKIHLNRALDLALPDQLYAPLAEARKNIGTMFDEELNARNPVALRYICDLWNQLIPSWTSIYQKRMKREFVSNLTVREHEIAKYAALGLTNDEIATKLAIKTGTVRTHISSVLQKTGLKSRNELSKYFTMN